MVGGQERIPLEPTAGNRDHLKRESPSEQAMWVSDCRQLPWEVARGWWTSTQTAEDGGRILGGVVKPSAIWEDGQALWKRMAKETGQRTLLARFRCLWTTPLQTILRGQDLWLRITFWESEILVILSLGEEWSCYSEGWVCKWITHLHWRLVGAITHLIRVTDFSSLVDSLSGKGSSKSGMRVIKKISLISDVFCLVSACQVWLVELIISLCLQMCGSKELWIKKKL